MTSNKRRIDVGTTLFHGYVPAGGEGGGCLQTVEIRIKKLYLGIVWNNLGIRDSRAFLRRVC